MVCTQDIQLLSTMHTSNLKQVLQDHFPLAGMYFYKPYAILGTELLERGHFKQKEQQGSRQMVITRFRFRLC